MSRSPIKLVSPRLRKRRIATAVVPAYRKLKEFIVSDYLPAAWDQVGIWQLPNGAAMYAYADAR